MVSPSSSSSVAYGCAAVAIVSYGSNWVFAKDVNLGDGVFFQWAMCVAIWCTSLPVMMQVQAFPATTEEFSFVMVGGFLWCSGNMLCGPVIQLVGLSMGMLLWGSSNMLLGWASGTFGLFGLTPEPVQAPALNYAGVSLVVLGLVLYLHVRPGDGDRDGTSASQSGGEHLLGDSVDTGAGAKAAAGYGSSSSSGSDCYSPLSGNPAAAAAAPADLFAGLAPVQRRVLGFSLALLVGALFGCSFDPSQYVIDHPRGGGTEDTLLFVFPQFCGILLASTAYLLLYLLLHKYYYRRPPFVSSAVLLPALCSGLLWGLATICWFAANQVLGFSVSFPLITSGPGFVGSLWGILKYGEIRGRRNFGYLGAAFAVTLVALVMIAESRG